MDTDFPYRRRTPWFLFMAVFFLYLFSTSREKPWGDATPLWELGDSLANRQSIAIKTRWPKSLGPGKDGRTYAVAPVLQGVMHAPGAFLQRQFGLRFPTYQHIFYRLTCHLAPTVLGTLACVLFFGLCRRLRIGPWPAGLATLGLATATSVWVYARYPYSEALQLCCFTGFFAKVLDVRERPNRINGALLGLWTGLLLHAKLVYVVCLPGLAVVLLLFLWKRWRALLTVIIAASTVFLPLLGIILLYNHARWGSVLSTGYDLSNQAGLRENPLVSLFGILFSPGKSIFLYSPPLLLAVFAFPRFVRRYRDVVWAMVLTIVPPLLVTLRMVSWAGDFSWGPRYVLFATAVLLLPVALLVQDWLGQLKAIRRIMAIGVLGVTLLFGATVTYLGNAIYWDHFIRVQGDVSRQWLGMPNSSGDGVSIPGRTCAVCFEQLYSLHWLPPFQHIVGNYWLFTHVTKNHSWAVAALDAPWRRYTTANFNAAESYNRARVDWWFVEFKRQFPWLSWSLLFALLLASGSGFVLFGRELYRASPKNVDGVATQ
jgi:hypothetical protein